jgi:hypothetical protein
MSVILYHFVAIVFIGAVLWTMFTFAYPGLAIDNALALAIALAAIVIEGTIVFFWRRIARQK